MIQYDMAPKTSALLNNYNNTARKTEFNSLQAASSAGCINGLSMGQCQPSPMRSGTQSTGSHGLGNRPRSVDVQDRPQATRNQSPGVLRPSAYNDCGPWHRVNSQYRQGDNCSATGRDQQPGQGPRIISPV